VTDLRRAGQLNTAQVETLPSDRLAPLHHADWRFLLPRSGVQPLELVLLIGGPPGLAARLRQVGLARKVTASMSDAGSADLVAILNDAVVPIADLADRLKPGGILYLEVDRRSPASIALTPGRMKRLLLSAGVRPIGCYGALPTFQSRKVYLPLELRGAFRWFTRTLYPPTTAARRLMEGGLRLASRLNRAGMEGVAPCFCVLGIAGTSETCPAAVLSHPGLPMSARQPGLQPLLLADRGNRVVVLPFGKDDAEPRAILKIPKLPAFNDRTENDQATLENIRGRVNSQLRQSIPEPLGIFRWGDISVAAEGYGAGRPLSSSSGLWGGRLGPKVDDLRLASSWLAEFHRQTELRRPPWGEHETGKWVEGPFQAYYELFGTTADEDRLFSAVRSHASALGGTPLPIVPLHRDFNVWNVFRHQGDLTVIDWEGGRPGPALCDLLHFVTHWHEAARGLRSQAAQLGGFRRLFCELPTRDPAVRTVHAVIRDYMEVLRLEPRFYPVLLVYTWVEMALRRAEQQRLQGSLAEDVRSGNQNVDLIGILAANTDHLLPITSGSAVPRAEGEDGGIPIR